jgi:hypothetical protein
MMEKWKGGRGRYWRSGVSLWHARPGRAAASACDRRRPLQGRGGGPRRRSGLRNSPRPLCAGAARSCHLAVEMLPAGLVSCASGQKSFWRKIMPLASCFARSLLRLGRAERESVSRPNGRREQRSRPCRSGPSIWLHDKGESAEIDFRPGPVLPAGADEWPKMETLRRRRLGGTKAGGPTHRHTHVNWRPNEVATAPARDGTRPAAYEMK